MGSIMDQERPWRRKDYDPKKEANSKPIDWTEHIFREKDRVEKKPQPEPLRKWEPSRSKK